MKIYTVRAKQKQRKYHEEQIHYLLDGSPEYNWRKVQKEIKECLELESLPSKRTFITDRVEFLELKKYGWLKSDYRLPILNNKLIDFITSKSDFEFRTFPITIQNDRNKSDKNENFSAFYIKEYLDCVNHEMSPKVKYGENEYYEYKNAILRTDIEYPVLFKIKGISTPYMHFTNEINKTKLEDVNMLGVDFKDVSTVK